MNKKFRKILMMGQYELKAYLKNVLKSSGYKVVDGDGYLYAKGIEPYLLTAHMDTVHKQRIKTIDEFVDASESHIITSPQGIGGDDRCGVYMILELIKKYKCSVLFCEDEEIGGVGSGKFCKTKYIDDLKEMKFLIELDRQGKRDAVFYDCDNEDFIKFVENETGFREEWGTFSDISHLAPACGVAAVNLSVGYYKQHTTSEYIVLEEMEDAIRATERLIEAECPNQFEYIEARYWKSAYDSAYEYYGGYYNEKEFAYAEYEYEVCYEENGEWKYQEIPASSMREAVGAFLIEHDEMRFKDIVDVYMIQ